MTDEQNMHINAAFSTELDAPRVLTLESDYYSSVIPKKYSEWDLDLYATKWFDYRMMTPLQATKVYIDCYAAVYKRIYAREFDRERAEHIKPIDFDKLRIGIQKGATKEKTKFVGCWHGRQIADFIGIPYMDYIDLAMTFRMRRWKQGYMPQPQHLYHEYDVEKIVDRWEEMKKGRLYLADHHAYLNQNYQGIAHQDAYHEYLFMMAELRANPHQALANMIDNDQLLPEKVQNRLGAELYKRVERHLS
ncbi:hypothetical protein [Agrobacterium sp. CG674]